MMSTFTGTREQARPRMMGRHPGQVSYPSKEYVMCVNEGVKASGCRLTVGRTADHARAVRDRSIVRFGCLPARSR